MHTIHNLEQGSDAWHAHRAAHFNASEAAAMLGISQYQTRSDLLHQKATGMVPSVDTPTQRRFDDGHAAEAAARPIAEAIIGADLYPITASMEVDGLPLSASYDGATMEEDIIFEHKLANQELIASLANGCIPEQYRPQMEQQLLILGATKCLFMASNGDGQLHAWYESDPKLRAALIAGWKQFQTDLFSYVPPEVIPAAVAAPQMALPAVAVTVTGNIAIRDNLTVFGDALAAYVERINMKPQSDQDFADLEATVKALKTAEEALDAAESNALAQTGDLDFLRRTVGQYRDLARQNRLMVEKLVKAEKENRRNAIMQGGISALRVHIDALNKRLGRPYMPDTQWANFPVAMKGLKTMTSLQNAVDTELARAKIDASACADRIEINLNTLRDMAKDHAFLFADAPQIVLKDNDDLVAVIKSRISDHKAAEDKRLEAEREKIRAEEEAKAEQREKERQAGMAGAVLESRQKEETTETHAATQLVTPAIAQADAQSAAGERTAAADRVEAAHATAAWPGPVQESIRNGTMTTGRAHDLLDELTADMTVSELAKVLDAAMGVLSQRQPKGSGQ